MACSARWLWLALPLLALTAPACTVRMDLGADGSVDARGGLDARPDAAGCSVDRDCTDRIACSIDRCGPGSCTHTACLDCCPDGLACNTALGCTTPPVPCTVDGECSDGIRCTLDSCGTSGVCERRPEPGLCGAGEVCLAGVGCIPTPPTSCDTVEDCRRGSLCAADWLCEPEFGCTFVAPLDCGDADDCTIDGCDDTALGCVHTPIDVDEDGHAPDSCAGGDDCDDTDADVSPNSTEACNTIDDDCDGRTDEGCCTPGPCTTSCGSAGTMGCDPDGTPTACTPPAEACNGSDDNCDGTIDEGCCTAGPCTTSCGTTGVRGCNADGTPGACNPPAETCNDVDDDCDTMIDEGFGCRLGTSTSCTTTCGSTGTRACLPGCTVDSVCAPPAEICNGIDDNCNTAIDETFTCAAGATRDCTLLGFFDGDAICRSDCSSFNTSTCSNCGNGTIQSGESCDGVALGGATCSSRGYFGGTLRCAPGCAYDESSCTNCGNGTIQSGETCDGAALGGATCASRGYATGTLRCGSSCGYDESMCSNCGNGVLNPPEACDGAALGGATCASLGYAAGTLTCQAGCTYNTAGCTYCGNGVINVGEDCDGTNLNGQSCMTVPGGFSGGTLGCTSGCRFSTTTCTSPWNPTGTYTTSPRPAYSCGPFGIVSFNIAAFTFNDNGTTLLVGGAPCGPVGNMSGASARATRMFDVSCVYAGSCNETYRLVGMFTTDNRWTGTFYASYSGSCFTCSNQSFATSGMR